MTAVSPAGGASRWRGRTGGSATRGSIRVSTSRAGRHQANGSWPGGAGFSVVTVGPLILGWHDVGGAPLLPAPADLRRDGDGVGGARAAVLPDDRAHHADAVADGVEVASPAQPLVLV